jgi:hypothetical protein
MHMDRNWTKTLSEGFFSANPRKWAVWKNVIGWLDPDRGVMVIFLEDTPCPQHVQQHCKPHPHPRHRNVKQRNGEIRETIKAA